jgi:ComF family protein
MYMIFQRFFMAWDNVKKLVWRAVDTVLPPRCPISGDMVDRQGMIAPAGWARLSFIAAPYCAACGIPFEYGMEEGGQCMACLEHPPLFGRARAALRYDEASREMILGFKHGDKTYTVASFVPMLRQAGREVLEAADVLVPVPLHPYRLIRRRYNQAALIAQALAADSGLSHWPAALRRVRSTPTQGHLNAQERRKNVRKAFAVNPAFAGGLKGRRVVLIDDVYTSGATVHECTKVLQKAGVAGVDVLTVARVVRG